MIANGNLLPRASVVLLAALLLAGCESYFDAERPTDEEREDMNAAERFLSPERQRAGTLPQRVDTLIDTPSRPIDGPRVRSTDPRQRPLTGQQRPPVAFRFGSGGRPDTEILDEDAAQVTTFDADGDGEPETRRVSLSFDGDPLDFVLQQILNGILRENYLLSADGSTPITFRTERPLPVTELLPLLRGIVAREGLELRRIEGVYHVGPPDVIAAIAEARGTLGGNGFVTEAIPVGEGLALEIAPVIQTVLGTEDTAVVAVPSADRIVIRALPEEVASARRLLATMFGQTLGNRVAAILPVRAATPAQIALEVEQVLGEEEGEASSTGVTIVPLSAQQSVLIAARSDRRLRDVRRLIAELDNDIRERPQVRVVALTYIDATTVTEQLLELLLGIVQAPVETISQGAEPQSSRILAARDIRQQVGPNAGAADIATFEAEQEQQGGGGGNGGTLGGRTTGPGLTGAPAQVSGADIPPGGESRRLQQQDFFPGSGLPDLSIVPDVRNNALLIRSSYEDFLQIRELVIALDVPQPQLVLEGTILQVDLNDTLEFGVQFFLQENGLTVRNSEFAGGLITPDGLGLTALGNVGAISGLGLEILVSALQQVTDVKVISSPYLSVVSGQTASLTVGDEIPFLTATQDSAQTGEVVVTNEVETRQTGITVEVTPQIRPDDSVRMQIITNVSNALPTVAGAELTPTIARRDLQSEVTVRSGGTIVLGGLISGTLTLDEGGIPVLREIPILGNLFGVTDSEVRRSELIVLMTPRVTRTAFEIERITEQVRAQIAID
ncbi:MAG: hypothetical protein AAFS07_07065 [Pseudomonadota bacterium]